VIGNQSAAEAALIKAPTWEWRGEVSRGACFAVCCACVNKDVVEQNLVVPGGSLVLEGETHG